jgi:Lon protease-like protein
VPVVTVVPQFPLGSVLLPTMVLPLHVFEPRYRALTHDVLEADREFGVPLIERGWEVGGGDVRSDVGTIAHIVEARQLPDGRWGLLTVGVRRYRVLHWLADDPYPRAEVEDWPDEPGEVDPARYGAAVAALRRTLALASELGEPAPPSTVELSDDPATGSFQLAALAPVGPHDKQAMLRAPSAGDRIELVHRSLDDLAELLALQLRADDEDGDDRPEHS